MYHDDFYRCSAKTILTSPVFNEVRRQECNLLRKYGVSSKTDVVLSLGSGRGSLEVQMAGEVGKVVGIDISEEAVCQARSNAKKANCFNVEFHAVDLGSLSFAQNSFDGIWAISFLHHLDKETILYLLRQSRIWLKPGGAFVCIEPSSKRFIGAFKFLCRKRYQELHSPDERELGAVWLTREFTEAGYRDTTIRYCDFFLWPIPWLCPTFPLGLFRILSALNVLLLRIPVVKRFASAFLMVAKKVAVQKCFRDGIPGFVIAAMQAFEVFLRYAKLWKLERSTR